MATRKTTAFQMYYPPSLYRRGRWLELAVIQKSCYNQNQYEDRSSGHDI